MKSVVYRYVSISGEIAQIINERKILSVNPAMNYLTFYTPERFDDPAEAQRKLSLPYLPSHRIGPIAIEEIEDQDSKLVYHTVEPRFGQPGLGLEVTTRNAVFLLGLFNFQTRQWDL